MRFRRKVPSTVDAIRWDGPADIWRVLNWLAQKNVCISRWQFHSTDITVPVGQVDTARAQHGDWIILHDDGAFSVRGHTSFEHEYEEAPR